MENPALHPTQIEFHPIQPRQILPFPGWKTIAHPRPKFAQPTAGKK
jgi:hypothetical protein